MPAAAIAAAFSAWATASWPGSCSPCPAGRLGGSSPHTLMAPAAALFEARGTLSPDESTDSNGRHVTNPDPFGARASLGPGLPDLYRLSALEDRLDLDRAPVT